MTTTPMAAALLALALVDAAGHRQDATSGVAGRVMDAGDGAPIVGALVTVEGRSMPDDPAQYTDAAGRFRWQRLPRGEYRLTAERPGYLRRSVHVSTGEPEAVVRLTPGAVIAGTVADTFGEPIPNLIVRAAGVANSEMRTAISDDRGAYRIWGLPAGRYVLSARLDVPDRMRGTGSLPVATYYPGVQTRSRAEVLAVRAGQEMADTNFVVSFGQHAAAEITVLDSTGAPAGVAEVWAIEDGGDDVTTRGALPGGAPGRFTVHALAPGDYRIAAVVSRGPSGIEYAEQPIVVDGHETTVPIVVATAPVARASGRLRIAPGASTLNAGRLSLTTAASDGAHAAHGVLPQFASAIGADGRFTVPVPPGRRMLQVRGLPPGWAATAIRIAGEDVLDRAIVFESASAIDDVDVVISDRLATFTGSIAGGTADERPVAVLFSADRSRWIRGGRSVLTAEADETGAFRITGVRPGEYRIAAVPARDAAWWRDPAVLDALLGRSTVVAVSLDAPAAPMRLTLNPG